METYTWVSAWVASAIEMCKAIVGEVEMPCSTVDRGVGLGSSGNQPRCWPRCAGGVYYCARGRPTIGRGRL